MNSNFNLNHHCYSDLLNITPSNNPLINNVSKDKMNISNSNSSSLHQNSNIFYKKNQEFKNFSFRYDFACDNNKFNSNSARKNFLFSEEKKEPKKVISYYENSFKLSSKTVLGKINTCLLNLCTKLTKDKNCYDKEEENCNSIEDNNRYEEENYKIYNIPKKNKDNDSKIFRKNISNKNDVYRLNINLNENDIQSNLNNISNEKNYNFKKMPYYNEKNNNNLLNLKNPAKINKENYSTDKNNNSNINMLNKKTNRVSVCKNENITGDIFLLNQISVNGISISKFPVVSMKDEEIQIQLIPQILKISDNFSVVDKYYTKIPVLDEEKYSSQNYENIFKKEKEKIPDLYLIDNNINENNPIKLIQNFYRQIKQKILILQNNYLRTKNIDKKYCNELKKLIDSCNAITNTVTDYKKSGLKRKIFTNNEENNNTNSNISNKKFVSQIKEEDKNIETENSANKKQKQKHFKTYLCEFCNKAYSNGQGLGGHMSRIHPNQSYKYKDKIRIRRERENKRENLLKTKKFLFKKYGEDYEKLIKEKNKEYIHKFLMEHNEEYRELRKKNQLPEIQEINNEHFLIKYNNINDEKKYGLSKEKTNYKTIEKFNNNENEGINKENKYTSETFPKMKINFESNKY